MVIGYLAISQKLPSIEQLGRLVKDGFGKSIAYAL